MDNNWQRPLRLHWVLGAAFSAAFVLLVGWLVHIPYMTVDGPDGRLTLAEATPDGYRQLAEAQILDGNDSWGPMALAAGRLVVRDLTRMMCLEVAKR